MSLEATWDRRHPEVAPLITGSCTVPKLTVRVRFPSPARRWATYVRGKRGPRLLACLPGGRAPRPPRCGRLRLVGVGLRKNPRHRPWCGRLRWVGVRPRKTPAQTLVRTLALGRGPPSQNPGTDPGADACAGSGSALAKPRHRPWCGRLRWVGVRPRKTPAQTLVRTLALGRGPPSQNPGTDPGADACAGSGSALAKPRHRPWCGRLRWVGVRPRKTPAQTLVRTLALGRGPPSQNPGTDPGADACAGSGSALARTPGTDPGADACALRAASRAPSRTTSSAHRRTPGGHHRTDHPFATAARR